MRSKKRVIQKLAAYSVHVFTALGAVLGLLAILLTYQGFYQLTVWTLFAAVIVDSVDGTLARAAQTKVRAPAVDGALMDNIIDFVTWTVAPLLWLFAVTSIPAWPLLICALASIFGFTNVEAKTSDNFFTGFPSFWNFVAYYLFLLSLPTLWSIVILLIFATATVVPIRFVYPSKTVQFRTLTVLLGVVYMCQFIALIILYQESPLWIVYSSFIFPVYYFLLSFYLHLKNDKA